MPNKDTLKIKPIKELFLKHSKGLSTTVDPFARDCDLCSFTNDVNPNTKAQQNMYALDFLKQFQHLPFVLFDPPYSMYQIKVAYENYGKQVFSQQDAGNAVRWTKERDAIAERQKEGDIVMSLGWSSTCMGKKRGYKIKEILLVSHGTANHDTICTIEIKDTEQ